MKRLFSLWSLLLVTFIGAQAAIVLQSPNGKIQIDVSVGDQLTYSVKANGEVLMQNNEIALQLADGTVWGKKSKLKSKKFTKINEVIRPLFPLKKASIDNRCNVLTLLFKGNYGVQFRAYDDGVAYRLMSSLNGTLTVADETCRLGLGSDALLHLQMNRSFHTSCEQPYRNVKVTELQEKDGVSNLPLLIDTKKGFKILVSEGGQWDYPGMFFKGTGTNILQSTTPVNPKSEKGEKRYIAQTQGTRNFPWRYFAITANDGELLECTMSARLADRCKIDDTSWIKPGQVSWDWWNGLNCFGPDVNFKCGINTATYKYFIDFASKYKIPYIILDEGWATSRENVMDVRGEVDIPELISYGKGKNVGVILWMHWTGVVKYPNAMAHYAKMGVKGMKIDFMDRSDQEMVNFYEHTVAEAAKNHLVIDFHGAYKPAGLEFLYPNLLSYEGVLGMEQGGGCKPDNTLYEPFIRNVAGPMDYTPGAMISMQPEVYHSSHPNNASIGTRAYQMALYIVLESNIQMLSDTPSNYYRNADCTEFIAGVPVNWDDTRALAAEVGSYEIIAKRNGAKWFIGGITNSTPQVKDVTLDFLEAGRTYTLTAFEDGVNAGYQALHYVKTSRQVKKDDKVTINMVRNGGYAAKIE